MTRELHFQLRGGRAVFPPAPDEPRRLRCPKLITACPAAPEDANLRISNVSKACHSPLVPSMLLRKGLSRYLSLVSTKGPSRYPRPVIHGIVLLSRYPAVTLSFGVVRFDAQRAIVRRLSPSSREIHRCEDTFAERTPIACRSDSLRMRDMPPSAWFTSGRAGAFHALQEVHFAP